MRREWVRPSVCVRAVVVLGVVAGCATARGSIESSTDLKNAAPVTRLLIFEDVGRSLSADLYRGFVERVRSGLTSCGVTTSIEQVRGPVDSNQLVAGPIESYHASSVMLIEADGGEDMRDRSNGTDTYKLRFNLRLLDVVSNKVTWMANTKLYVTTSWATDDVESGGRFAAAIVSRMQDDGVLTGCPGGQ